VVPSLDDPAYISYLGVEPQVFLDLPYDPDLGPIPFYILWSVTCLIRTSRTSTKKSSIGRVFPLKKKNTGNTSPAGYLFIAADSTPFVGVTIIIG
jgi:hypothetical protein